MRGEGGGGAANRPGERWFAMGDLGGFLVPDFSDSGNEIHVANSSSTFIFVRGKSELRQQVKQPS